MSQQDHATEPADAGSTSVLDQPTAPSKQATPSRARPVFVVDGNNFARFGKRRAELAPLLVLEAHLAEAYGADSYRILVSASLRYDLGDEDRQTLNARLRERKWFQTPARELDDRYVLGFARQLGAIVLTNDQYNDHQQLRVGVPLWRPFIADGCVVLPPDAERFDTDDHSSRMPIDDLIRRAA